MKDPLENYILDQKHTLDIYEPDDRMWERIDKELYRDRRPQRFAIWKIAASVLILLSVGFSYLWLRPVAPSEITKVDEVQMNLQDLYSPELVEIETYYTTMIANQKNQIQAYKAAGIVIDDNMFELPEELSIQYKELQKELLSTEDSQIIINALIQNLTMQMEILNQQLTILEQIKSMKNENQNSL